MDHLQKLPDSQIKPASLELSSMPFYLHWLLFAVVKRRNLLFSQTLISSLEALSGFRVETDIVQNIVKDYTHLTDTGKTIVLCWIPSHVNICGNKRVVDAAKSAVSLPITNMKLPARELILSSV